MTYRKVARILLIRPLQGMVNAVYTQHLDIALYSFENDLVVLSQDNIEENLEKIAGNFPSRSIRDNINDVGRIYNLVKSFRPDIIHVNALQDLISASLAKRLISDGNKPAIIAMSHNPLSWGSTKKDRFNAQVIKLFSDGFVALTTNHKNLLLRLGLPQDKLTVITNPYDPKQLKIMEQAAYGVEKNEKRIVNVLYVANICKRKAQDVLIEVASKISVKYPQVKFNLIGRVIRSEQAYAEQLVQSVKKYGIETSVNFMGEISYHEVLTILNNCDIVIFPTKAEMMPRAVIEAMVAGKPVIASAVDGILDLIQDRKTGILVAPDNIGGFEQALSELVANPGFADALGRAGHEFILDYCSPENVGYQFCSFYEHILNSP